MAAGKKPSEIINERPDLAEGFDNLVKIDAPRRTKARGSGSTSPSAHSRDQLEQSLELPSI
jgi:hypothetical protein